MKANYRRVLTRFEPETRFEVKPTPPAPFRAVDENEFERLKGRLLAESLGRAWDADLNSRVRWAANEAAALAWVTPYPLLVFPALFEEKTEMALMRAERQAEILERSRELLAA